MDETFALADEERLEAVGGRSPADEFLDELMPPDLDWRGMVRRHPIPALCVAGLVGWWIGRSRRGAALAEAAVGAVAVGALGRLGGSVGAGDADELDGELDGSDFGV